MVKRKRDYAAETKWENSPEQVARRVARNKARRHAIAKGRVRKGDGKELDHVGFHRRGAHALDNVPTKVTSRRANRKRQPPRS